MRVLISGAGIAGPTLAWFLAKIGARITVVEKSKFLTPYGQNVDMQGSAISVIKKMGLMEEVRRWNTTEKGSQFISPSGKPFAAFPVVEGNSASMTSEFEILRGDLAAIIHRATKDHPNIEYMFGATVQEVLSNDDHPVKIRLSGGEVQEYDLVVAADGQWSKLRKQCFPPDSVKVDHKGMYVVYWTIPRLPTDNDFWNIYQALGSKIITLRPDPHGTIRAMFTIMPCGDAQEKAWRNASRSDRKTQEELLRKEFSEAGWQAQRLLDSMAQAPDFYFHVIEQIKMDKWSNNRVVCIGDAAHAPTPITGCGTTLAITGAYLLAGELSKLKDGEHPRKALEAYESIFHPHVVEWQKVPKFFPDFAHPETAWKRWVFQMCISGVSRLVRIPWVRSWAPDDSKDDEFPLPEYPRFETPSTN
ncbi:MAG: hypothetical protein L6R41_000401 [Letrouitia leprolyta]|nr:MAG: hypothetical protein L6R41_000401 [Letrouitia leprolyta]